MTYIELASTGRRRVALLAALGVLAVALVPAEASAHTLSVRAVKPKQRAAALDLARALDGAGVTTETGVNGTLGVENALLGPCERRSAHKVICLIGANGVATFDDGYSERFLCDALFTARFASARSRRIRASTSDLRCGPEQQPARAARKYALAGG